jgi:hypothetical protein
MQSSTARTSASGHLQPQLAASPQHIIRAARLCLPKISSGLAQAQRCGSFAGMIDLFKLLGGWLVGLFRSHAGREAEIMFLRHQLLILTRSAAPRLRLRTADRLIFVWLYRLCPSLNGAVIIFKPETLASKRLPSLLALEVATSCRPAGGPDRDQ